MATLRPRTILQCLMCTLLTGTAVGQEGSDVLLSPTPNPREASITSAAPSSSGSSGVIASLWSGGESLISSLYPSSSVGNIATLTWPSSVVIGSSTVSVPHSSTSSSHVIPSSQATPSSHATTDPSGATSTPISSLVAEPTQTASDPQPTTADKPGERNKILGIVLGVVLGVLALAIVLCVFLFCRRRQRKRRILRQYETPVEEDEIQSWRFPSSNPPVSQVPATYSTLLPPPPTRYSRNNPYDSISSPYHNGNGMYRNPNNSYQNEEAMRSLEGAAPYDSSTSEENPFYTPEERRSLRNSAEAFNERARVPHDFSDPNRPPTPFASALMGTPKRKPVAPHRKPVPLSQNVQRSSHDVIHYPSNSEASDFNFGFAPSKVDDFGDPRGSGYHSSSGEGWAEQQVHPAYRT